MVRDSGDLDILDENGQVVWRNGNGGLCLPFDDTAEKEPPAPPQACPGPGPRGHLAPAAGRVGAPGAHRLLRRRRVGRGADQVTTPRRQSGGAVFGADVEPVEDRAYEG
ncbi:hypothetical protein NKH77_43505 [Streptomyces sp. M19]